MKQIYVSFSSLFVRFDFNLIKQFSAVLLGFVFTISFVTQTNAAPGDLDLTFGAGRVLTAIGNGEDTGTSVALQSDGKIIMAGSYHNGSNYDFAVVRYHPDGSLDMSFGTGGKAITTIGIGDERANAVVVQPDGKIIAAGYYINGTASDFALVRYNANGLLDTSFGSGGKLTTQTSSSTDEVYALALQADEKIIAAGRATNGNGTDFIIVRYHPNGVPDTSFNGSGMRFFNFFADVNEGVQGLAIQSDGRIVASGYTYNGSSYDFALLRLNTNGSHDASTTTNFGSGTADEMSSLLIEPDGKIVAGGYSNSNFALARYNTNLSLDTGFGTGGVLTTSFGTGSNVIGVARQTDGKIFAAGSTGNDFALARYNTDGSLDTTFSGDGKQTTDLNGGTDGARGIVIQPDGKVAVAGVAYNGSNNDFAVARFNTNGSLDATFAPNGKVRTAINNRDDYGNDTAIQPDGKIIVVGGTNTLANSSRDFVVARYNADGTLDTTFSDDGRVTTNVRGDDEALAVAIQTDGRIVVGGISTVGVGADFTIVRYLANGTLDNSFSGDGMDVRNISQIDTGVADSNDVINDILVEPDGKIVAAGYADNGTAAGSNFAVVRYNENGTPDNFFNGDGIFVSDATGSGQSDQATSITRHSDGTKYVVAGSTISATNYSVALLRINASNGSLDGSFNGNGKVITSGNIVARDVVLLSDNRILVAGNTNGANEDFMLARYLSNGPLDPTFGSGGIVTTAAGTSHDAVTNVAFQADGKIIAAGHSLSGSTGYDFTIARYNAGGSLDTSFGVGGIAKTVFGNGNDFISGLALQSDGKIVVGGHTNNGTNNDLALARFLPGADCTYSLAPAGTSVSPLASSGSFIVATNETYCTWTATSNDGWISVTGGASGTGNGTVNYSIAANSGAARTGTITVGGQTFTVNQEQAAISVSIPTGMQSLKNGVITAPVSVTSTTGRNAISFDYAVTYDPAVLTPAATPVDTAGTMTSGWEINYNANTAGILRISGFRTTALTGAGVLMNLKFTATGNPPSCSPIAFSSFVFNDGNPASATTNGQACIINGSVAGRVTNPNTASNAAVPGVTLTAVGGSTFSDVTDASGDYLLEGFGNGTYAVTPSKTGDVNNAVSSLDASLIARYAVQLETLSANQIIAADVSQSGTINSFDAALIAQYLVGLSNPGNAGTWKFTPASRGYTNLIENETGEDYSAILMGDVTGNWTAPSAPLAGAESQDKSASQNPVTVSLPNGYAALGQIVTVPVRVGDTSERGILAYDFELRFDPSVLRLDAVEPVSKNQTISSQLSVTANANEQARLMVAAYGTQPVTGAGTLLNVRFRVIGQAGQTSPLTWERFRFNEDQSLSSAQNGQLQIVSPTAASVTVGGRVLRSDGMGISKAALTLTDASGNTFRTTTNAFGYYQFEDVSVGGLYMISVAAKQHTFAQSIQVVNVEGQLSNVDFIADGK